MTRSAQEKYLRARDRRPTFRCSSREPAPRSCRPICHAGGLSIARGMRRGKQDHFAIERRDEIRRRYARRERR